MTVTVTVPRTPWPLPLFSLYQWLAESHAHHRDFCGCLERFFIDNKIQQPGEIALRHRVACRSLCKSQDSVQALATLTIQHLAHHKNQNITRDQKRVTKFTLGTWTWWTFNLPAYTGITASDVIIIHSQKILYTEYRYCGNAQTCFIFTQMPQIHVNKMPQI